MKVNEYRDLISDVSDTLASAKSAANEDEMKTEVRRLLPKIEALNKATCPRANKNDRAKAVRVSEQARQFCCDFLMMRYDNQRIEAEYMGMPY